MPSVLIDTDVVSYLFKKDSRARLYRKHLIGKRWALSFMTIAELERWALGRNWGQASHAGLGRYLRSFEVFHSDIALCVLWAEISDRARRKGKPIDVADAWIAATALALGIPLITHNKQDYVAVDGLAIISEA